MSTKQPSIRERLGLSVMRFGSNLGRAIAQPPSRASSLSAKKFEYRWPVYNEGKPQWQIADFPSIVESGFNMNAIIYETIMYKAKAMTDAPLRAYTGDRRNPILAPPEHPLSKLLFRPNTNMSMEQFIMIAAVYWNLSGNLFIYCDRPTPDALPTSLWLLRPDRCFIVPAQDNIMGYLYRPEGAHLREGFPILPSDMIHIKLPNPGDPFDGLGYGLSPISPIARSADVDNQVTKFLKNFFDHAPNPPGLLSYDIELDDDTVTRARARWTEVYGGADKWADIAVIDSGAKYEKLGYTFDEMGFETVDERNESRIMGPFGVNPILLGSRLGLMRSTLANYQTARTAFWKDTMSPELKLMASPLSYALSTPDGAFVMFDTTGITELRDDITEQVDAAYKMWQMSTPAFIAYQTVGLHVPRYPGDDQSWVPGTLLPDGRLIEPTAANPGLPEGTGPVQEPTGDSTDGDPTSSADDTRQPDAPATGKQHKIKLADPRAVVRFERDMAALRRRFQPEIRDAAKAMLKDMQWEALAVLNQVKTANRKARKSFSYDDFMDGYDDWLDKPKTDETLERHYLPIFSSLAGAAVQAMLASGVLPQEYSSKYTSVPLASQDWWHDYWPPFLDGAKDTTANGIKAVINQAIADGWGVDRTANQINLLFDQWSGTQVDTSKWLLDRLPPNRAYLISRSELLRASNRATTEAYISVGVPYKEWHVGPNPCEWCAPLDGKIVEVDTLFFEKGDVYQVTIGDVEKALNLDYEDVPAPPLHNNCECTVLPAFAQVEIATDEQGDGEGD